MKVFGWPFRFAVKHVHFPRGWICVKFETVKTDAVLRLLSSSVPGLVPVPMEEKPCVRLSISSWVLKTSRDKDSLLSSSISSLFQPGRKVFLMSNMKLPHCDPWPLPPYGVTCHYQEEFDPIIFAAELQIVVLNVLLIWPQSWKKPGFLSFLWGPDTPLAQNRGPASFRVKAKHLYNHPRAPSEPQAEVSLPCRQLGRVIDLFDMDWGHSQSRHEQRKIHIRGFLESRTGKNNLWCLTSGL